MLYDGVLLERLSRERSARWNCAAPSNCEEIFPSVEQQRISRDKLLSEISIWKAEGLGAMTGGQGGERSLLDKLSDICDVQLG